MESRAMSVVNCVERITRAFDELHSTMSTPESVYFGGIHESFERLELSLGKKAAIDAAFAFVAERDDAGRHVGSSRPEDYLTARLRIPKHEAYARIRNGKELFEKLAEPVAANPEELETKAAAQLAKELAAVEGTDGSAAEPAGASEARAAEIRQELEAAERERLTRESAELEAERERREALLNPSSGRGIGAQVMNMIESELNSLSKHAVPGPKVLRAKAVAMAQHRTYSAVRAWLRDQVGQANRTAVDPAGKRDPYAAIRKRWLHLGKPDHDGGVSIRGYLDPATAALLTAALAPARNRGSATMAPDEDTRTFGQRMVDQLATVVADFEEGKQASKHGLGSIVITTTTDELEELDVDSKLCTTTGVELSPLDVLRVGAARHDFVCVVDEAGLPLELGRGQRTASLWQKLALAATELVCTHPECDRPWASCDVHHLQAWSQNGPTDIKNLTLLCRRHHTDNNDYRNGSRNMGHAERCPETQRVGHRYSGSHTVTLNDNPSALKASARRLVDQKSRSRMDSSGISVPRMRGSGVPRMRGSGVPSERGSGVPSEHRSGVPEARVSR